MNDVCRVRSEYVRPSDVTSRMASASSRLKLKSDKRAIRLLAHDGGSDGRQAARQLLADLGHDEVDHQWWRHAPSPTMGAGTEWEGTRFYRQADGPGRGCFPVTVVRIG